MTSKISLREAERKVFTSTFQDGFWDIYWGLLMLSMGLRIITDIIWYTLGFFPAILILILGKKLITTRRLGYVKFGSVRKSRLKKARIVIVISVLATFVLLFPCLSGRSPSKIASTVLLGGGCTFILWLVAYFMDFSRLYMYGLLLGISISLTELLGIHNPAGPVGFSISGGIALIIGLAMFVRFLHRYPTPAEKPTTAEVTSVDQ